MNDSLATAQREALVRLALRLIDQERARVAVAPYAAAEGYWFGGGSMVEGEDGALYLVGRYRNRGDSRTGLTSGARGLELAIFRSQDRGASFTKLLSLSKRDLDGGGRPVVSIEGASLLVGGPASGSSVELFVSVEREASYPSGFERYQKPGTGVWSIEHLSARSVEGLAAARPEPLLAGGDPATLHVKDPVAHVAPSGATVLVFCHHPYSWSSSNAGVAVRPRGAAAFGEPRFALLPRGLTWDVAVSRVTDLLRVPKRGLFADGPERILLFYDGAECVRAHPEGPHAVRRARGFSCEEIGGLAVASGEDWRAIEGGDADRAGEPFGARIERLSPYEPLFVSPYGSGSSRYVHVTSLAEGLVATWQQSQPNRSQPLVINTLPAAEVEAILAGAR